jgi:hypothetical protein
MPSSHNSIAVVVGSTLDVPAIPAMYPRSTSHVPGRAVSADEPRLAAGTRQVNRRPGAAHTVSRTRSASARHAAASPAA